MNERMEEFLRILQNPCVKCVIDPPRDRSICSNCVSSGSMERALKRVNAFRAKWGVKISYQKGVISLEVEE